MAKVRRHSVMAGVGPAVGFCLAVTGPVAVSAQTLAPTPPAICSAVTRSPMAAATAALSDTAAINGVVVRFTASATGRITDGHLAKALSTVTARRLQAIVAVPVRSRFDVSDLRRADNTATAIADGRVLGVRWVVAGRVERTEDSVSIIWNVLDSRTGVVRGTGATRDAFVRLDATAERLSIAIARKIGRAADSAPRARIASTTRSVSAFEAYLAGLFEYDSFEPAAVRRAASALRNAVEAEPTLQAAWTALAESLARLVEWGEGGSARGRSQRSRDGIRAANRALALAPRDVRALSVLAHLHLLRDEPLAASQVIDGLRRVAPASEDLAWLTTELMFLRGDAREMTSSMAGSLPEAGRHIRTLYQRAEWERRTGSLPVACQSLNRLLVLEPSWAPAYVQRALVRTALGDRRGGWQDAEMATRLGQPLWGSMVSALIDFSVSDSLRTRARLRALDAVDEDTVLPWLDALLRGAVWRATGQKARAIDVISVTPCDDPRRRRFAGDPLLRDVEVSPDRCRASVGLSNPAGNFSQ